MDQTNDTLSSLLDCLKDEIARWELAPSDDPVAQAKEEERIRYGLYLIAMDVLLCETAERGGYAAYAAMPATAKLDEADYNAFKVQLVPFILWLDRLNIKRVVELKDSGLTVAQAEAEANFEEQTAFNLWLESARSATL